MVAVYYNGQNSRAKDGCLCGCPELASWKIYPTLDGDRIVSHTHITALHEHVGAAIWVDPICVVAPHRVCSDAEVSYDHIVACIWVQGPEC